MNSGTNNRTRLVLFLDRYGRLLSLCSLSLLLHAMLIAWLDVRIAPPPTDDLPGLAIRLARALPSPPAPAAPIPAPAAAPVLPEETAPPAPVEHVAPPTPSAQDSPAATPQGGELRQTPSRYRVTMPPSVTLRYEVRGPSGPAREALLRWETDGVEYRMALDGILGEIESEGGTDDAGIAPRRASYRLGAGTASVGFERERRAIVFESVMRSDQDMPGSQDGATLLMQLAGIGLADPDQLQEAVDIYVGRAEGAAVERFEVLGRERLATPLGSLETIRLARAAGPRLEIWLAPDRGWLPVQLRTNAPDGSARTQVVQAITAGP